MDILWPAGDTGRFKIEQYIIKKLMKAVSFQGDSYFIAAKTPAHVIYRENKTF